ncbi:type I restriction endonuclease subunit R [Rhodospirillum sp. A1_3_36]|uniref:type I restriction endonuclease subunit R n=1 Tax=Rhodospirillum sp. A1_3_36 TaxID=3391666 RepID=UPI0039A41105
MPIITEDSIEHLTLDWLQVLGYTVLPGPRIGPDGASPERQSHGDVILVDRLRGALLRINPDLPEDAIEEVLKQVHDAATPSLIEENRRLHLMLTDGVDVEVLLPDGSVSGQKAFLVDFADPSANDWLAVNQVTVIEGGHNRRPDVLVFVNGLPLGVIELKNPGNADATIQGAFNQLQTYKAEIPSLFRTNLFLVISDGLKARVGSLTADEERFMPWRTKDGTTVLKKGVPELETLLVGIFEPRRLLDFLRGFVVFDSDGSVLIKKIAGYHQFHAVRHALAKTLEASAVAGDRKVGVIWHTQGSGKSLLMAFYAGRVIAEPAMANPTLVIITDRNDLDDQLYGTFSGCQDLIRQTPKQAEDRKSLRTLLSVPAGGVIFTTLQKFMPEEGDEHPRLTDRANVVVIADEAHRSQYGMRAKVRRDTGERAYGYAKYLRDALPNASFIGFTGTPIESGDVNTPAVFGDYIDIYDIQRAVEDGATVPISYESRLARIELDPEEVPKVDAEVEELIDEEETEAAEKLKGKWSRVEALVGADKRLQSVAKDIVAHFEARLVGMDGKGMIVCMSRRICVALYDEIIKLRPDWDSDDDKTGVLKVVMTGSATDPERWQKHIGGKTRRDTLAKRARKADDPLKLVIVRDMWLTGFDAPPMHTMYLDKPMKGHGLMQAIARVNRVFRDKPGGLIVDYIGLAQNLKHALSDYSEGDRDKVGIDEEEAVAVLLEQYEIVRQIFHGFDYAPGVSGTPHQRLETIAGAMEWVLEYQKQEAAKAKTDKERKAAWRLYADAVLALSKAFALAAASDEAKEIRDEIGFFQVVRAALAKTDGDKKKSQADRDLAVQQIINRAVVSTDIVDILHAAGVERADISILSDAFLEDVRRMDKKNLALEALKKLINGQIRSRLKTNVVETRDFTERLQAAIARYHNNALTSVQVIEELIQIAKDLKAASAKGEALGLSQEEWAFYQALADNESARDVMGDKNLAVIAQELLTNVRGSTGVDWTHSEAARARIRRQVKRILKKYGFPPDLEAGAVQLVLQQAEALAGEWAKDPM